MKVTISKSSAEGIVSVPTSKSMTIRALMCAALAKGESEVVHPLVSEDTEAAVAVLEQIGVKIKKDPDIWRVTGGVFRIPQKELYCGESATTLRFMTAICSLLPGKHRLVGGPSLMKRPVKSLVEALRMLGVKAFTEGRTTPPVIVEGGTLTGDTTVLPGLSLIHI
ncbi:MAG: 3-phosphoshikimate 1-carboxyvinyltransferase, partial [Dehalococcoidales bacterium]|nr:3-phosphoshikimate 1-carboxyvinyltransferase [Dehalococcoidales bacterium]